MSEVNSHFSDPWFWCCVEEAIDSGFLEQWLRLYGHSLPRNAIEKAIDAATGYSDDVSRQFLASVKDVVYDRIPHPLEVV